MYPVLFRFPESWPLVGGAGLHSYGLMIAIAFLCGLIYVRRESTRVGLDVDVMADLFFYTITSALIGSRVFYLIHSVDDFWADPLVAFRIWEGGLVFQGGIIGALLFVVPFARKHKLRFFKVADVFAVPLALGHGIGRLGCFLAGCCHGKQCDINFPLAVVFPANPDTVAPAGIPLYPTQITEAFAEFLIFGFLFYFRKKKPFDGAVFLLYMMIYAVLRSFIELYRGDTIRGFVIEPYLSNGQFLSLIGFILAATAWVYLAGKKKKEQ